MLISCLGDGGVRPLDYTCISACVIGLHRKGTKFHGLISDFMKIDQNVASRLKLLIRCPFLAE